MSNCLIFAVLLWWRGRKRRAKSRQKGNRHYFAIRRSDSGWFPHFLWIERHHVISYKPHHPIDRKFPPPLFRGRVCWGDKYKH